MFNTSRCATRDRKRGVETLALLQLERERRRVAPQQQLGKSCSNAARWMSAAS